MRLSPHWILASFTLGAAGLLASPGCKNVMAKQSSNSGINAGSRSYGRDRSARNQQETRIAFEDRSMEWGLPSSDYILEKQPKNIEETFGSGCAFADLNGDQFDEAIVVHHNGIRIYRNNAGKGFTDISKTWAPALSGRLHGIAAGDVDADGRVDLVIGGHPGLFFLRNTGTKLVASRINPISDTTSWWSSIALTHIDRGRTLDIVAGRYVGFGASSAQVCSVDGVPTACGSFHYAAQTTAAFISRGRNTFLDVSKRIGLQSAASRVTGVAPQDFDNDGDTDLLLLSDSDGSSLLENNGRMRFTNLGARSGIPLDTTGDFQQRYGADWADIDGDAKADIVIGTGLDQLSALYSNRGNGFFLDVAPMRGLLGSKRRHSAGVLFEDFDADGHMDVFSVSGHFQSNIDMLKPGVTYRQPCLVLAGEAGGTFEDVSERVGVGVQRPLTGRGLAASDIDHDGDVDVLITDVEGPARLFENVSRSAGGVATIHLQRRKGSAIGAIVLAGGVRREVQTARGYLSASSEDVVIAFPAGKKQLSMKVTWPGGVTETYPVKVGTSEVLLEGRGTP